MMKITYLIFITLIILFSISNVSGQVNFTIGTEYEIGLIAQDDYAETSSWEPEDLTPIYSALDTTDEYIRIPGILFINKLIKLYQQKISPNSISRCPFYISCSNFAYFSINKYGLLKGICLFIDRHFYREHPYSFYYYGLREIEVGILKIDDSFYLFGDKNQ